MRVVAELPRPDCKITIFSMNGKYIIKFEKGSFEQTYKLSEMDLLEGLDGAFQLLDEEFIRTVVARFDEMLSDFSSTWKRHEA